MILTSDFRIDQKKKWSNFLKKQMLALKNSF
jgi:hypothetical protein